MKKIIKKTVSPPMSERELRNAQISRRAASEGMVLLQNRNGVLPIKSGQTKIALFGCGAVRTVRGGTGSGDPFNGGLSGGAQSGVNQSPRYHVNILDAFIDSGYEIVTEDHLRDYAVGYDKGMQEVAGNPMLTFTYPEAELKKETVREFSEQSDTAIYVLARNSGEGSDRENEAGGYLLSQTEINNLKYITESFEKTVLILNVGGVIDMSEIVQMDKLDSILLMGQAGQEGGNAVLDVLTGAVTPSGKLTDTWAKSYSDYPASETFANNDNNVEVEKYTEGIYVGYRWFDSFNSSPIYPFGFGLSYTSFNVDHLQQSVINDVVAIKVRVTNTGDKYSGKEVVQVYLSAPEVRIERSYQELVAFAKTGLLSPGESEEFTLSFRLSDFSCFDYDNACYLLEKGEYRIRIGTSSRDNAPAFVVKLSRDVITRTVNHELPLSQPLEEITRLGEPYGLEEGDWTAVPVLDVDPDIIPCIDSRSVYQDEAVTTYTTDKNYKPQLAYEKLELKETRDIMLSDVAEGKATLEDLVAQLSYEELAVLNCGTGWGVANEDAPIVGANSSTIAGAAGETTTSLSEKYGIPSIVLVDGPGGLRVNQEFEATDTETGAKVMKYQYYTSWPVGTLLGQSFDLAIVEEVGKAFSEELDELGASIVLGPGQNIHRDPLCGRNFEYYSEDPLLSGLMSAAIVKGIQSRPHTGACIKHFAANNQETNRNSVDTIVSERALREIYLRNFEITVKESHPISIMTSYNLINGVPAADSFDLCTNIARGEWGFEGVIMTDWNGGQSTPSKSMHAGNDLIMPGGPGRVKNIVLAANITPPTFDERGQVTFFEERMIITLLRPEWNSFTPDPEGKEMAEAALGSDYSATVKDGIILVNGHEIYMEHIPDVPKRFRRPGMEPGFAHPVTTKDASVSEDGRYIRYKGTMTKDHTICKGDIQKCAINNLKMIMRCAKMQ